MQRVCQETKVIEYARKNHIPYFEFVMNAAHGSEYTKNVLKLKDASTEEIKPNAKDLGRGNGRAERKKTGDMVVQCAWDSIGRC